MQYSFYFYSVTCIHARLYALLLRYQNFMKQKNVEKTIFFSTFATQTATR